MKRREGCSWSVGVEGSFRDLSRNAIRELVILGPRVDLRAATYVLEYICPLLVVTQRSIGGNYSSS